MLDALLVWDERIFRLLNRDWLHPILDRLLPFVSDPRTFTLPFIVAAVVIVLMGRLRGLRFLVLAVATVVVADAIGTHIFKYSFLRARPCIGLTDVTLLMGCTNSYSFPSNHAVNTSALATLAVLYMPRLWLPATALVWLVGYSRVYVGVHYPLDVLAGIVLGIVVALVLSRVMNFLWPSSSEPAQRRRIFSVKKGRSLEANGAIVDRDLGTIMMADSLRPQLSHVSLIRRIQLGMVPLQTSAQLLDRVIDVAIMAFLICSVVSITGAQAAILVAQAAWLGKLVRAPDHRALHLPLLLPMAAFYLASVLTSVTAADPWLSFKDLRNVFEPAFFFLLVNHMSGEARATTFSYILIAAATLMAVYGLTQSIAEGPAFRVHGTMSIYMTFAGILMLIALVVLAQLLFLPRGRWSLGLVWALVLLTAALVMTHTRGAWIGIAAGGTLILAFRQKRFLLALPAVAVVIFLASPEDVRARIRSIVDPQDVTSRERLYMWGSGLQIIRDHPWTGVGIHGVMSVYGAYKHPNAVRDQRGHLHSNLLQVAAERGLIGVACWLWIWVAFYRQTWKIFRRLRPDNPRATALVVGSLASVTAFHVAGLFEYTFGDSEVIMLVYFLMALPYVVRGADREARLHGTQV